MCTTASAAGIRLGVSVTIARRWGAGLLALKGSGPI
jgi:hypothetical protein